MSYFRICPYCGAALDPGERCDCLEGEAKENKEKAAQGATNTKGGMVEQVLTDAVSTSIIHNRKDGSQV